MALAGIGDASAVIAVAELGFKLSQTLITIISDKRDAAVNINRLRDEVHLTSICLQQLGDLAERKLLRDYGILETTNLRDRTRAVIWEIRTAIKKSDHPLHPVEIQKEDIDVTCFQSWKWAIWTKKQLQSPREELDRLKDSMTLTYLSHMALLATDEADRKRYAQQIPGLKRSIEWSEEGFNEDLLRERLQAAGLSSQQAEAILAGEDNVINAGPTVNATVMPSEPELKAWTIEPLQAIREIPVSNEWLEKFSTGIGDDNVWEMFEKLHPWYKNEITRLSQEGGRNLVMIKPSYKHRWSRKMPQSVQIVMKTGSSSTLTQVIEPIELKIGTGQATYSEATNYADTIDVAADDIPAETDEEIIQKQLALYQ